MTDEEKIEKLISAITRILENRFDSDYGRTSYVADAPLDAAAELIAELQKND